MSRPRTLPLITLHRRERTSVPLAAKKNVKVPFSTENGDRNPLKRQEAISAAAAVEPPTAWDRIRDRAIRSVLEEGRTHKFARRQREYDDWWSSVQLRNDAPKVTEKTVLDWVHGKGGWKSANLLQWEREEAARREQRERTEIVIAPTPAPEFAKEEA